MAPALPERRDHGPRRVVRQEPEAVEVTDHTVEDV
jgi:hypothetical protein